MNFAWLNTSICVSDCCLFVCLFLCLQKVLGQRPTGHNSQPNKNQAQLWPTRTTAPYRSTPHQDNSVNPNQDPYTNKKEYSSGLIPARWGIVLVGSCPDTVYMESKGLTKEVEELEFQLRIIIKAFLPLKVAGNYVIKHNLYCLPICQDDPDTHIGNIFLSGGIEHGSKGNELLYSKSSSPSSSV